MDASDQWRRLIVASKAGQLLDLFFSFTVFAYKFQLQVWVNKQPNEQVAGIELQ